ncbi:MAG: FG-GAP-like repeat-containing protein [Chloroflexota bacterium]
MSRREPRRAGIARTGAVLAALAVVIPVLASASHTSAASTLFAPYQSIALGSDTKAVAIGDVTGDGRADVVATSAQGFYADYRLYVSASLADGTLAAPVSYPTPGTGTNRIESVAIGDITDDGREDVVVGAAGLGVLVYPQLATGLLGTPTVIPTPHTLRVAVGDLDGAGGIDLAAIGWGDDLVSVFLNDGQGSVGGATTYAARHSGYDDLEIGDVSGDGRDDIVVMSGQTYATPNVSVLPQLAGGGFGAAAEYRVGDQINSSGIGLGDVTGDGRLDVVAAYGGNRPQSRLAVFAQTSAGLLASPVSYPVYDIPTPVEVADLDKDGRGDVVTLHSAWLRAGVSLGRADGTLAPEDLYNLPYGSYDPHGLAVGDFTGDGWPDLAIADSNNGLVILRNLGSAPPPPSPTPTPTAVVTPKPTAIPTPTPTPVPTPTPQLPSAPRNLTSSPNLAAGVGLTWAEPTIQGTGGVSGYRIYRSADGASWGSLATVGTVLTFTDTTVPNGARFSYSVAALGPFGEGPRSSAVVAQRAVPPGTPTTLTATTAAGKTGIALSWKAPTSDGGSPVTGYRIYRGTASGSEAFLVSVGATTTSFTDASVGHKIRYYYRLTAVNAVGEGAAAAANVTSR